MQTVYSDEYKGEVRNNVKEIGCTEDSTAVLKIVVCGVLRDCGKREHGDAGSSAQEKDEQKPDSFCHFFILPPAFIWGKW